MYVHVLEGFLKPENLQPWLSPDVEQLFCVARAREFFQRAAHSVTGSKLEFLGKSLNGGPTLRMYLRAKSCDPILDHRRCHRRFRRCACPHGGVGDDVC